MGLIKITADMTESERTAAINTNMQYLQLSNRLRKYPIGKIVSFSTDIDPNELYGGTWERIKGRVIWGIDDGETAGCTGGEKTHTLTTAEMPKHSHDANSLTLVWNATGKNVAVTTEPANPNCGSEAKATTSVGGGGAHNNMMPYYGAYTWQKTGHGIGEDPTLTEYEALVRQMNTAISEALSKERLITNAACANALRGAASGSSVSLPDISPNEHTLGVKVRGKNLFNSSTQSVNMFIKVNTGIVGAQAGYTTSDYIPVSKATYTINYCRIIAFYDANKSFIRSYDPTSTVKYTFTINDETQYIRFSFSSEKTNVQMELGSAVTTYEPYVNPTSVNVTRCGKNLFDKDNANIITGYPDAENTINPAPTTRTVYIPCTPNTTYTVSKTVTARFNVAFTDVLPVSGATVTGRIQNNTATSITATSGTNSHYLVIWVYHAAHDTSITLDEVLATLQIEIGSTATEYEPYKMPTEYTPAADGTVSGVKSLYPTTTLMTDTEGAIIDAEYNRDINKAFAELQQAILSMGGNV